MITVLQYNQIFKGEFAYEKTFQKIMFVTCLHLYSTVFEWFFDLKIPFHYYLTSVCSTSEISPHSDIPDGSKIES